MVEHSVDDLGTSEAVKILVGPVGDVLALAVKTPEYMPADGSFTKDEFDTLVDFIKNNCLDDPYMLTALYLGNFKHPWGFYPISLLTAPFRNGGQNARKISESYSKVIAPFLSLHNGIYTDQKFDPSSVGIETLLTICDAKNALANIPIQDILYVTVPSVGKDIAFYQHRSIEFVDTETGQTIAQTTEERIRNFLCELNLTPPFQQADNPAVLLGEIPDSGSQTAVAWRRIQQIHNNLRDFLESINPISGDSYRLARVIHMENWLYNCLINGIPTETGKSSSGRINYIKPTNISELLDVVTFIAFLNIDSSREGYPIPTARALVTSYMIIEALIVNRQDELAVEFIEFLKGLGVETPRLDNFLEQIQSITYE